MACCGQKRAALKYHRTPGYESDGHHNATNTQTQYEIKELRFKYVGDSNMIVTGAISSKKYSFRFKEDICIVDARDAPAFMAETLLQKL